MKIISFLKLLRFPAVFTALADILSGYFIVSPGKESDSEILVALLLASAFLYLSGMVMNDYFDYDLDKVERPARPLPSGDIAKYNALMIFLVLSFSGIASAFFAGRSSLIISLILIICIVGYNRFTKTIPIIGPANMGLCRFMNMLLGMSTAVPEIGWKIIFPLLLMIYTVGITNLSSIEVKGGNKKKIITALLPFGIVIIATFLLSISGHLTDKGHLLFLVLVISLVTYHFIKIYLKPEAVNIRLGVTRLILSIILLDALFISGFIGLTYGILLSLLILPSIILSRIIYIT